MTAIKEHKCDICGRVFVKQKSLSNHRRHHNSEFKKKFNKNMKHVWEENSKPKGTSKWILSNKEWLHEKYIINKLSTGKIAELIGCNPYMVYYWLNQHKIQIRSFKEANKNLRPIGALSLNKITKIEKEFNNFVKKYNLPFKYVGNGSFWIGNLNPDFIDCNGRKVVVEIFGDYWHRDKEKNKRREQTLSKFGWKMIVFWESEIKKFGEQIFIDKLRGDGYYVGKRINGLD